MTCCYHSLVEVTVPALNHGKLARRESAQTCGVNVLCDGELPTSRPVKGDLAQKCLRFMGS